MYCEKLGNCNDDEDMLSNEEDEDGNLEASEVHCAPKDEGLQGRNVVKDLMQDLGGWGYIVITNKFFTLVL